MTITIKDLLETTPMVDPDPLDTSQRSTARLSLSEARLIGDLLGQKDAGIEMLSIKLETKDQGQTIQATFRTPLGTFSFNDCEVTLAKSMAPLVGLKEDSAGMRLAKDDKINADRYGRPTRKIRFETEE